MKLRILARGSAYALPAIAAASLLVALTATRSNGQASQPPTIKEVPCSAIASVEGKDNYMTYCAVCHGVTGKGDGPAAPALKGQLPDLTTIAARNGGKFDSLAMTRVISGVDKRPAAHGSVAMPIWGAAFASSTAGVADLRIQNLSKYLQTMQQK